MDKPSGAQERNVFHGGEVQGLLQLAVIPNWKSSERLAARHSLTCGTPSTSSSRSILLNLVNTEDWTGGWSGPSARANEEVHDRHDARRRKRARAPTKSEPSICSDDPSGPGSEVTASSSRRTRRRILRARRANSSGSEA